MPHKRTQEKSDPASAYFATWAQMAADAGVVVLDRRGFIIGRVQRLGAQVGMDLFKAIVADYLASTPFAGGHSAEGLVRVFENTANKLRGRMASESRQLERDALRRMGL